MFWKDRHKTIWSVGQAIENNANQYIEKKKVIITTQDIHFPWKQIEKCSHNGLHSVWSEYY